MNLSSSQVARARNAIDFLSSLPTVGSSTPTSMNNLGSQTTIDHTNSGINNIILYSYIIIIIRPVIIYNYIIHIKYIHNYNKNVTQDEKRWLSHYFEKNEIFTSLDSPFSWLFDGAFAFSIRRCNREISSETLTCLVPHNSPKNAI